jgi:hypothetical protein
VKQSFLGKGVPVSATPFLYSGTGLKPFVNLLWGERKIRQQLDLFDKMSPGNRTN